MHAAAWATVLFQMRLLNLVVSAIFRRSLFGVFKPKAID